MKLEYWINWNNNMALRRWVTGFRRFGAKYCPHLQGNNIRTE
jgi:hypothetical protein